MEYWISFLVETHTHATRGERIWTENGNGINALRWSSFEGGDTRLLPD